MKLDVEKLTDLIVGRLRKTGLSDEASVAVAEEIVYAEATGKLSHGVNMLKSMLKRARSQNSPPKILKDGATSCLIDGGGTVGPYVARLAMDLAIEKANKFGVGLVGVLNASPFLTAGYPVWRAATKFNMVSLCMSVAKSKVAAYGMKEPILGTNPIGFAIPATPNPIVVDMAIATMAAAEVELAKKEGRLLPTGAAIDKEGNPTTDPEAALKGALLPFDSYKGSALGIIVELMAGALIGAKCGFHGPDNRGMVFLTIKADLFQPLATVEELASGFRSDVHSGTPTTEDSPRIPGDRAGHLLSLAYAKGLEISDETYAELLSDEE